MNKQKETVEQDGGSRRVQQAVRRCVIWLPAQMMYLVLTGKAVISNLPIGEVISGYFDHQRNSFGLVFEGDTIEETPIGYHIPNLIAELQQIDIENLLHYKDTTVGLYATDSPDKLSDSANFDILFQLTA